MYLRCTYLELLDNLVNRILTPSPHAYILNGCTEKALNECSDVYAKKRLNHFARVISAFLRIIIMQCMTSFLFCSKIVKISASTDTDYDVKLIALTFSMFEVRSHLLRLSYIFKEITVITTLGSEVGNSWDWSEVWI